MINHCRGDTFLKATLVVFRESSPDFLKDIRSSSLDVGFLLFHYCQNDPTQFGGQSKTDFFSIQVSLYSIGSVFMIIIMLKSEAVANQMLELSVTIWPYCCAFIISSIWQNPPNHWLKFSPKPWQNLHCALMAVGTTAIIVCIF